MRPLGWVPPSRPTLPLPRRARSLDGPRIQSVLSWGPSRKMSSRQRTPPLSRTKHPRRLWAPMRRRRRSMPPCCWPAAGAPPHDGGRRLRPSFGPRRALPLPRRLCASAAIAAAAARAPGRRRREREQLDGKRTVPLRRRQRSAAGARALPSEAAERRRSRPRRRSSGGSCWSGRRWRGPRLARVAPTKRDDLVSAAAAPLPSIGSGTTAPTRSTATTRHDRRCQPSTPGASICGAPPTTKRTAATPRPSAPRMGRCGAGQSRRCSVSTPGCSKSSRIAAPRSEQEELRARAESWRRRRLRPSRRQSGRPARRGWTSAGETRSRLSRCHPRRPAPWLPWPRRGSAVWMLSLRMWTSRMLTMHVFRWIVKQRLLKMALQQTPAWSNPGASGRRRPPAKHL
mmetsp:Transcript_174670/g.560161  ORF Transcript_174670/g.560161 Transcript_174670/m.560161 type:complete len:399 (-) Transcript_174670:1349-2545(-)